MTSAAPEIPSLARDRAFEKLYSRYAKDVYRYSLALLRNPADAEDVTQTTFMNAYRAMQRGEQVEKPQHWLIKIAHNAARTRYARASRRVKEVPLEEHVEQLAISEDERPNVAAVLEALGHLPMNQRAAIVMRELEGRTYAEIADTLGVSVAAVETLIFRARRSLRLKASAIRVLGGVPLPASVSRLFEGGGIVAGGGGIAGSAMLLKAAAVVVAGLVATGVTSDHSRLAAAASANSGSSLGITTEQGSAVTAGSPTSVFSGAGATATGALRLPDGESVAVAGTPAELAAQAAAAQQQATGSSATGSSLPGADLSGTSVAASTPSSNVAATTTAVTSAVTGVVQPVAGTVSSVTDTVSSVTSTVSSVTSTVTIPTSVTVTVPSVTTTTVQLPPPPPPPPLP